MTRTSPSPGWSGIRKLLLTEQFSNWFATAFEKVGRMGNESAFAT